MKLVNKNGEKNEEKILKASLNIDLKYMLDLKYTLI